MAVEKIDDDDEVEDEEDAAADGDKNAHVVDEDENDDGEATDDPDLFPENMLCAAGAGDADVAEKEKVVDD